MALRQAATAGLAVGGGEAAEQERGGLLRDGLGDGLGLGLIELGDFVEAVVNGLALGEAAEEAPSDDLAADGTGLAEVAVLVVGLVVPFQGPERVISTETGWTSGRIGWVEPRGYSIYGRVARVAS